MVSENTEVVSFYRNNGHLNIITQMLGVLYSIEADMICFLDHDCLYPIDYFERVSTVKATHPTARGVSNLDYIGMNGTGYVDVIQRHEPMSQLSLELGYAIENLESKLKECILYGSACVEPDNKSELIQIPFEGKLPVIHVNMNESAHNHHFTNHAAVCYESDSRGKLNHPYWGAHRQFQFF